jgi:deoxycytidine triphosphate deaminase
MLMTDGEIKQAIERNELVIEDYKEAQLQPCAYDARAGEEALVSGTDQLIKLSKSDSVTLRAGDFALIMTYESFKLPLDMAGHIGMKSGLARRGLVLLAGIQIDPGFDGHLRLGFYNSSGRRITLDYLDDICTIEFHRLARPVDKGILPISELKEGKIPDVDKAYLRELETVSLSDLSKDLRTLTQSVNILTKVAYYVAIPLFIAMLAGIAANLFMR